MKKINVKEIYVFFKGFNHWIKIDNTVYYAD